MLTKTIVLFVAGIFAGLSCLAFMQGQFVYGAVYAVPMFALLYIFFRLA
jgi:hypothetical protein